MQPTSKRSQLLLWMALVTVTVGFEYGYTLAIIAGAESFLVERFRLSAWQLGFAVSNLSLGAAIGSILAGPLGDRWGRKSLLAMTSGLFLLSALLSAMAVGIEMLMLSRVLGGLAVGATLMMPLYVAELAPPKSRGLLVSLVQIGIVTGILVASCVGWLLADWGEESWRWMFAIGGVPALPMAVIVALLPESPRWLISRGRWSEAEAVLESVMTVEESQRSFDEWKETDASLSTGKGCWRDRKTVWPLAVGVLLAVLSVTVGINAVILYGPAILMKGTADGLEAALLGGVALALVNFWFSVIALLTIDRFGRKPLLLVGLAGMALAMLGMAWRFGDSIDATSSGLLLPILAFIAFYAMSLGPVSWVIISEIFPTRIRGTAMALCMVVMYLADFGVTLVFPKLMESFGAGAFLVFAGIGATGWILVSVLVPETKNRSLEEIESLW